MRGDADSFAAAPLQDVASRAARLRGWRSAVAAGNPVARQELCSAGISTELQPKQQLRHEPPLPGAAATVTAGTPRLGGGGSGTRVLGLRRVRYRVLTE